MPRPDTLDNAIAFLNKVHPELGNTLDKLAKSGQENADAGRGLLKSYEYAIYILSREGSDSGKDHYNHLLSLTEGVFASLRATPDFAEEYQKLSRGEGSLMNIIDYMSGEGSKCSEASPKVISYLIEKEGVTTGHLDRIFKSQTNDSSPALNDKFLEIYKAQKAISGRKGEDASFDPVYEKICSNPGTRLLMGAKEKSLDDLRELMNEMAGTKPELGKFTAQLASGSSPGFAIKL